MDTSEVNAWITKGQFNWVQTIPPQGSLEVIRNPTIDFYFDVAADSETLTPSRIRLFSGVMEIPGRIHSDLIERRVRFIPEDLLRANLRYQIYLSKEIRGLNGEALQKSIVSDFTTGDMTIPMASLPQGPKASDLQPIWNARCAAYCHSSFEAKARLDLSSESAVQKSLSHIPSAYKNLPLIYPFDNGKSYLMRKLLGEGGFLGMPMPPDGPRLSIKELRQIADWIDSGTPQ